MDLSTYSAKKIVCKSLKVDPANLVLIRLGGWLTNVDSPIFLNGIQNTPDPVGFDSAFPQTSARFQAVVAVKAGETIGRDFVIEMTQEEIEALIAAGQPGEFDI